MENEPPKTFWKRSSKLPRTLFGWLVLITALAAIITALENLLVYQEIQWDLVTATTLIVAALAVLALFLRWLCHWKNFKRFLFFEACLITLFALVATEENWRGKRAWMNERLALEKRGEKLTVLEIAPPPVPDDQNFALTPLLKPALEFVHTTNGVEWRDTNAYARLEQFRAFLGEGVTNDAGRRNLEGGSLTDLEATRNFYRSNINYPQPTKPGTAAEAVLTALSKFDTGLDELRHAAATRAQSRFPIEYDYQPAAAILLPHLAEVKCIADVANLRATALLQSGRVPDAFTDLQLSFRLSDSIKDEPLLVDHLVRLTILGECLQTIREGLARHAWNDAQLAELELRLRQLNLLAELKNGVRGERVLVIDWINYMRQRGLLNPDDLVGGWAPVRKATGLLLNGFYYQNMLTISRLHDRYTLPAVDETKRRLFPDIVEAGEKVIADARGLHPHWLYAKWLFPALSSAFRKSGQMQTYVDAARVACALERFRLAHGNFPEALAALSPSYIDSIPADVIDGQPLRYRPTSDGYVLYSVGWNKTDEGGTLGWATKTEKSLNNRNGDWVWFYPSK